MINNILKSIGASALVLSLVGCTAPTYSMMLVKDDYQKVDTTPLGNSVIVSERPSSRVVIGEMSGSEFSEYGAVFEVAVLNKSGATFDFGPKNILINPEQSNARILSYDDMSKIIEHKKSVNDALNIAGMFLVAAAAGVANDPSAAEQSVDSLQQSMESTDSNIDDI